MKSTFTSLFMFLFIQVPVLSFVLNGASSRTTRLMGASTSQAFNLMKNPWRNKGTSFSGKERDEHHLHGLLPAGDPLPLELKVELAMAQLRKKASPIDKYIFLHTIQDSDETLFYAVLAKYTKETMPLVYTPTVGQACQEWSHIYRQQPRGIYIGINNRGKILDMLKAYPNKDIKAIVFTDGERILGLGDLGTNGMGIPVGKLALYTTCAGIHPEQCLPVTLDVGTNTESIRNDPFYMGLKQPRDRSQAYDDLVEEFFQACHTLYGRNVLMQFEDFGNSNAFRLLERYRHRATVFNDDIQGTASVVVAGLISSMQLTKTSKLGDRKYLFYGAGEAGIGIADLLVSAIAAESKCSIEEARKACWFVDSKGLISAERLKNGGKLEDHKLHYAHDASLLPGGSTNGMGNSLLDAVKLVQPTALIGVSAQGQSFTKEVIEQMMRYTSNPLIFALSNPTHKAECSAIDAYTWSQGKAVFASGSPFDSVVINGKQYVPGQGNNAYIFPGVGLGALVAEALEITDEDFLVAARTLAGMVTPDRLAEGCVYPDLSNIREVSKQIAAAVAKNVYDTGRSAMKSKPSKDWLSLCDDAMYVPKY